MSFLSTTAVICAIGLIGLAVGCDDCPGYELALKVWAKSGEDVRDLWESDRVVGCAGVGSTLLAAGNYKSNRVNTWDNVQKVKIVFYDGQGFEISSATFNGQGKNKLNFMSKANLLESSFSDLDGNSPANFFSVEGHDAGNHVKRNFYINKSYGGCPNDYGWMVVNGCRDFPCSWDHGEGCPSFQTARNKVGKWGTGDIVNACIFAIYLA